MQNLRVGGNASLKVDRMASKHMAVCCLHCLDW